MNRTTRLKKRGPLAALAAALSPGDGQEGSARSVSDGKKGTARSLLVLPRFRFPQHETEALGEQNWTNPTI